MQKIYYPYTQFQTDLKCLVEKIDKPFNAIVGISRGGLSMAQMLGEYYNLREVYAINTIGYEGTKKLDNIEVFNVPELKAVKSVLVVDDIADSGDTLVEVLKVLKEMYPTITFYTATLFYKPTSCFKPTWWVKEPQGWIDFFWSEDLKDG
jgi:xanthine phosphoribosyltransferase